jgi:hypothetical protein
MKNLKLTEQMRDIVMLLTLAGVACLTFTGSDCDCETKTAWMKSAVERRIGASQRPTQGPRTGGFEGKRGERGKKKRGEGGAMGAGANLPQYPSSSK